MTGEEKRKQLKEQLKAQYKKDLQLRKDFLEKAKNLKHSQKLNETISDLVGSLEDDSDTWIDALNQGSALSEAKLDIMMDQASETARELDRMAKEAEMQKFAAQDLIRQMKQEMGLKTEEPAPEKEVPAKPAAEKENPDVASPPLPPPVKKQKKLGDF